MPKRALRRGIDDKPYQSGSATLINSSAGGGANVPISRRLVAGEGIAITPPDGRLDEDLTIGLSPTVAGVGLSYSVGVLGVNASLGLTVSGDSVILDPNVAGAALAYSSGVLSVIPGEGLELEGDAVGLKATVAGAGLTYNLGVLNVGAGAGLTVNADDIALNTPGTLSVASTNVAAGSHLHQVLSSANVATTPAASLLASDSAGMLTLKRLGIGTVVETNSNNINALGHMVMAAAQNMWFVADSDNNDSTASIAFGFNSPNTTGLAEVIRISELGRLGVKTTSPSYPLDVTGAGRFTTNVYTPDISTVSGNLTIDPVGDLYLSPGGLDTITTFASAVRSDNFLKTILIAGYRIGPTSIAGQTGIQAGSAEFDELRARVFVADETRIDRGQEYITKSYGILSRPFTSPSAVGGTVNIYVENSPHIIGAVFQGTTAANGDWIMFRYLDMTSGITLTSVWGQVYGYSISGLTGEQRWTFILRAGSANLPFIKGALAIDFGSAAANPGYILSDAVTATAPYFQVGRWTTNPYTPANYTVLAQLGRLDGVGFTGDYGFAATQTNFNPTSSWIRLSASAAVMNNMPLQLWYYNGVTTDQTVNISANGRNIWVGPNSSDKRLSWDGTTLKVTGDILVTGGNAATTSNITGAINLVSNSSFELDSNNDGLADGFNIYNNDGALVPTYAQTITNAERSTKAQRIIWSGTNASSKGIYFDTGRHKADVSYVLTFWCRTSLPIAVGLAHNIQPNKVNLIWPQADSTWRFFAVKVTWPARVAVPPALPIDPDTFDSWYITINYGQAVLNGWIDFDNVMVYEGDSIVPYQSAASDLVGYGGKINMPSAPTAGVSGLYMTSTNLGFWDGTKWNTWMTNTGEFYFGNNTGASLRWVSGRLSGYDSGNNEQWYASASDGKLYAGNGNVILDREGMSLKLWAGSEFENSGAITWKRADHAYQTRLYSTLGPYQFVFQYPSFNFNPETSLRIQTGVNMYKIWHQANDGIGSGLDADLLDGFNLSVSGNRWGAITYTADDGVTEIGRYLDFHATDADTGDYAFRIDSVSSGMTLIPGGAYAGGFYTPFNGSGFGYWDYTYNGTRTGYALWNATYLQFVTEANKHIILSPTGTTGRVGIVTTTPEYTLDITGEMRITGAIRTNTGISFLPVSTPAASAVYFVLFLDAADGRLKYRTRSGDGGAVRNLTFI